MGEQRPWVADDSIGWRILLTARFAASQPSQGRDDARIDAELADLQRRLVAPDPEPVRVVPTEHGVVISAHHSAVDGLGLLEVLERTGHGTVRSSARGIGDAVPDSLTHGIRARLAEALLQPPALPRPPRRTAQPGDVMVAAQVPGRRATAALVWAGSAAVTAWQAERGASAEHVTIAVGASRGARAPGAPLADDSVLLRLRDLERCDPDEIASLLRSARPEPSPQAAAGSPVLGAVMGWGMRALRPRLGSTLLISHLGEVSAPGIDRMAFHPVTAGGSGISLGAVGHSGRTTVTLRARAAQWDDDGLEQLLEAIVQRL